jgi:hypothetical protein
LPPVNSATKWAFAVVVQTEAEVVYERAIIAVRHLRHCIGRTNPILGTNGESTTLRAITGFLGLDDARVTEGAISFKGERLDARKRSSTKARYSLVLGRCRRAAIGNCGFQHRIWSEK